METKDYAGRTEEERMDDLSNDFNDFPGIDPDAERESSYTPGERKVQKVVMDSGIHFTADGSIFYSIFVKTGKSKSGGATWESCGEFIENERDAILYAAAPDLLEACKKVMANIKAMTSFIPFPTIEQLEAAIAKAEGR